MSWRPDRRVAAVLTAGVLLGALLAAPLGQTYAAWSDTAVIASNVGAKAWLTAGDPPLPPECAGMDFDRIIVGTNKSEQLVGTPGDDLVFGLQGQDVLDGLGGDDCLVGDQGKDPVLLGGDGDDVLVGGNGKDQLYGGRGDDRLHGGNGKDLLVGGDGDDVLDGGAGEDDERQGGPNAPSSTTLRSTSDSPTATIGAP